MGLIDRILGHGAAEVGGAVRDVAEVFTENRTARMEGEIAARTGAQAQFAAEFSRAGGSRFDAFVNGLNRLPRPVFALGTVGLFGFAMVDPDGFERRMAGLSAVPEPLWWLLGAIVSFYFGARELHHAREDRRDAARR
ncbi:MAG: holin family protein [Rubricella sp.]